MGMDTEDTSFDVEIKEEGESELFMGSSMNEEIPQTILPTGHVLIHTAPTLITNTVTVPGAAGAPNSLVFSTQNQNTSISTQIQRNISFQHPHTHTRCHRISPKMVAVSLALRNSGPHSGIANAMLPNSSTQDETSTSIIPNKTPNIEAKRDCRVILHNSECQTSLFSPRIQEQLKNLTHKAKDPVSVSVSPIEAESLACSRMSNSNSTTVESLTKEIRQHEENVHVFNVPANTKQIFYEKCNECGVEFHRAEDLAHHKFTYHNPYSHNCPHCVKAFISDSTLKLHMKLHISQSVPVLEDSDSRHLIEPVTLNLEKRFNCGQCSLKFRYRWELAAHALTHTNTGDTGRYKCKICGEEDFISLVSFNLHTSRHPENRPYKCKEDGCDKTYARWDGLKSHMSTHTGVMPYECNACQIGFPHRPALKRHRDRVHNKNKIDCTCEECGKVLVSLDALELHKGIHTGDKHYKCTVLDCDKSFASQVGFKAHRDSHAGEKRTKYTCDECGNVYFHKKSLAYHKDRVHNKNKCEYKCEECGKVLVSISALELHMGIHTGDKHYKCTVPDCDKTFASLGGFKAHKDSHIGEKRHKCDECESSFDRPQYLKNHKDKVHSDSIFQCRFCEKSFTQPEGLKDHSVIHEYSDQPDDNIFKCSQCDRIFSNAKDQKRHIQTHEKRFKCQKCEEVFNCSSKLRSHVIFKHRFDEDVQQMYWKQQ